MGDIPVLWENDPTKFVGKFDLDSNEITLNKPFLVGGPEFEIAPVIRIMESEEVDGVTFIKKAKLLALGVFPVPIERIGQ